MSTDRTVAGPGRTLDAVTDTHEGKTVTGQAPTAYTCFEYPGIDGVPSEPSSDRSRGRRPEVA